MLEAHPCPAPCPLEYGFVYADIDDEDRCNGPLVILVG